MDAKVKKDFLLGADPEFGFINPKTHRVISAFSMVKDDRFSRRFGLDGSQIIAEIRPSPARKPSELVANIRKEMLFGIEDNRKLNPNLIWKAGGMVGANPIGGHIHFGIKGIKTKIRYHNIVPVLDRYLAYPILLLEDPGEAKRRRSQYGVPGDYREQPWGFEYRTLSSWLTSPYIAVGVLCLAKAVVWDTLYNELGSTINCNKWGAITYERDNDFCDAKLSIILKIFNEEIWKNIIKLELYEKYKPPIDLLYTLISKKKNWFPSCGMKAAWGINFKKKARIKPEMIKMDLARIWQDAA